ncbi:MAG: dUTP diphosphatase [Candidatus Riflebacteria bacterium]|nr:dUTP diphosphatase [Candidatus Riflebacteria bacterium]
MPRTAPAAHPRPAPEAAVPAGPVVTVETVGGGAVALPARATHGAAGYDICSRETLTIAPGRFAKVPTGLKLAIPEGFEAQVRPRSGLAAKHGVTVLNAPGTIDSDYRGEVCVLLVNHGPEPFTVEAGMRIAQMVFAPVTTMAFATVASLAGSARGEGGFGSTGR